MCQQQFCETGGVCPCSCAPPDTRVPPRCTLVATRVPLRAPRLPPEPDHGPGTETFVLGRDNKRPSRDRGPPNPPPHWAPAPQIRGGQRGEAEPPLYDTPYEEWETAGEGAGPAAARESRLPRDDERPADEYDQPWEWKKDHISRAFAGARGQLPGAGLRDQPRRLLALAEVSAVPGHPGVTRARVACAWVYPGLCTHVSAHACARTQPVVFARLCGSVPQFPLRPPRSSQGFVHVKLTRTRERHFVLGRAGAAFPSVPEAVRHYTARALPVRGARHLSLLYPVAAQPL
uniref:Src homology 2 domain containing transforming protein D n=1 Tax=Apteryx owenii TaxID=8824 RepID=A0A8B9P2A5_APTOW